ncbi:MAG: SUF system NifU family Fe-S cluster assembly protein [Chloroflexi bacterium AL-W]|nr:SUF system NifU family Fe-S cluster assembly protein [Chloroflexi bacterium AL-N1]NOK68882.1 SUF system NifU family Fe-S cluster assembly protein [Chloroflexi bacterium AL-N10]NOK76865.1 SUF system NifU family Fe-S cluster assembly protein [Chloroflexi bacterium AL-N5]NOK82747.1 SUF system NifU family Fe-S cluster assembly protein [Chloroflexi bacterium AL-W]NOK90722.1 SUF system NifU family Fe-S cluster assembly protein [Chloroflexi bacterium AL-N15]
MDDLYREVIIEHHKYPHNAGVLENPHISHEEFNPLCGDRVRIDMYVESDIITDIRFQGRGCAISQASASMLTDEIKGKSLDEAKTFGKDELLDLIGIPLEHNPVRIKCALLSLKTLKVGIYTYIGEHLDDEEL